MEAPTEQNKREWMEILRWKIVCHEFTIHTTYNESIYFVFRTKSQKRSQNHEKSNHACMQVCIIKKNQLSLLIVIF